MGLDRAIDDIQKLSRSVGFDAKAFKCATLKDDPNRYVFQFPSEMKTVCFPAESEVETLPYDDQGVNSAKKCNSPRNRKISQQNLAELNKALNKEEAEPSQISQLLAQIISGEAPTERIKIVGLASPEGNRESNFLTSYQRGASLSNSLARTYCSSNDITGSADVDSSCEDSITEAISIVGAGITWEVSDSFKYENLGSRSEFSYGRAAILFVEGESCNE